MAVDQNLTLGTIFKADVTHFIAAIRSAQASLAKLNASLNSFSKATKGASSRVRGLGTEVSKTGKKINQTSKHTQALTKDTQVMGKQIGSVTGGWKKLVAAMKVTAAYTIAASAIFGVVNALKAGIDEIIAYDQALKNLQAITSATDAEVLAMGDTIKEVAISTKFSATEIADGMVLLGQAGFDAGESMDAMQATADLAAGTLSEMKTTTDLLTTAIRAFNLDTIESSRVADVMGNAVNKSKLTVDKLRIAFNFVGAAASQSSLSIEELAASMMVLANNGLRASTIGTGLRQVLARLIAPNEKLREAYLASGIALDKINPATVGYSESLKNLTAVLFDSEKGTVDMGKAFELFGLRGAQAAAILVKSYVSGSYQQMLDKVYEVGTAQEMAGIQAEGLAFKIKNLSDRFGVLAIAIGKGGIADALTILVSLLQAAVEVVINLAETIGGKIIIQMTAWATVIFLVIKAFTLLRLEMIRLALTSFILKIKDLVFAFRVLSIGATGVSGAIKTLTAMIGLSNIALGAFAIVIGLIVVGVNLLANASKNAAESLSKLIVQQKRTISSLEAHKGALEVLNKKYVEGEDVEKEYLATLQRLINKHPELKDSIDLSTDAWEKNAEVLDKFIDIAEKANLKSLAEQVRLYGEAAEEAKFKAGLLNIAITVATKIFKLLVFAVTSVVNTFVTLIEVTANVGAALARAFGLDKLAGILSFFGSIKEKVKDYVISMGEADTEGQDFAKNQEEALGQLVGAWTMYALKTGSSLEDIKKGLKATGDLSEEQMERVVEAIDKNLTAGVESTNNFVEQANEAMKKLGTEITPMFKKMFAGASAIQKAELAKMQKGLETELAAFKKWAEDHKISYQEMTEGMEAIRIKFQLAMIDLLNKEFLNEEQMLELRLAAIEQFVQDANAERDKALDANDERIVKELVQARLSEKEKQTIIAEGKKIEQAIIDTANAKIVAAEAAHLVELLKNYDNFVKQYEEKIQQKLEANNKIFELEKNQITQEFNWKLGELDKHLQKEEIALINSTDTDEEVARQRREIYDKYLNDNLAAAEQYILDMEDKIDDEIDIQKEITEELFKDREQFERDRVEMVGTELAKIGKEYDKEPKIVKEKNKKLFEIEQKGIQERKKLYEAYFSFLKSKYDEEISKLREIENTIKGLEQDRVSTRKSTDDLLRDLNQDLMTDEQKWYDDRSRADEKFNEAVRTGSTELTKEVIQDYGNLSKVVDDATGKQVKSIEETNRIAQAGVKKSQKLFEDLTQSAINAQEDLARESKSALEKIEESLKAVKEKITELNEQEIDLNTEKADQDLTDLKTKIDQFMRDIKDNKAELIVSFLGEGSSQGPLAEKIEEMKGLLASMQTDLEAMEGSFSISFEDSDGDDLGGSIEELRLAIEGLEEFINDAAPIFTVDTEDSETDLVNLDDLVNGLVNFINNNIPVFVIEGLDLAKAGLEKILTLFQQLAKEWVATLTIKIIGLDGLLQAKAAYDSIKDKTAMITIKTKEEKKEGGFIGGMQAGGRIPGVGSGDKVPVLAEPGEFMQPKDAVSKYGAAFMRAIQHKLLPKSAIDGLMSGLRFQMGGIVRRTPSITVQKLQMGGQVAPTQSPFSGQLHTINLNINSEPHTLFGDEDTVGKLTKTLRRNQLVSS